MEHGLDTQVITIFTAAVVLWSLVAARLERLGVTPALAFVVVGFVVAAVFATVLLSVVAHGLTARPLAGRYAAVVGRAAVTHGRVVTDHPRDPDRETTGRG